LGGFLELLYKGVATPEWFLYYIGVFPTCQVFYAQTT